MNYNENNLPEAIGATAATQERPQQQQVHPAPQMFDAFHQSPHGEFKPTFYNPFEVKHRRRTSRQQLKVLEKAFNENPKPHAAVRQALAQKLNMTPRGVQVWFQNRRAKAKKQKNVEDNPSPESNIAVSSPTDSLETFFSNADSTATTSTDHVTQANITTDPSMENINERAIAESIPNSPQGNKPYHCGFSTNQSEPFYAEEQKSVVSEILSHTENDQAPKRSRPKPNIDPLKTTWDTPEEYEHMVQQRQIHQLLQKTTSSQQDDSSEWMHSNVSSASTVASEYVYDHMDSLIPLSTPQSAVTIPDYFTEYTYSPTVSSVISEKDAIDNNEPLNPTSFANVRRNSCPELMVSILNMKLGTTEEKRSLSTIIEDETLYNDANLHQFLAVPTQVKRRFSEPINRYISNVSDFHSGHGHSLGTTMSSMTSNQAFSFNLLGSNQPHDNNVNSAPELLRGHSLDSTVWPTLKERQMWNYGMDLKAAKLPIVDTTDLKVNDGSAIGVAHWSPLTPSEIDANSVNSSMTMTMTDEMGFMHLYGNSNDQVVR
ncbi:14270_t:CDS:2 [Funneliformis caledonium]|uniref:14270_t:CDS:1 n=1 Tax=Funneliformis caledonium TaxID=1117310 RepID=A0A9N9CSC0_9GLOM|nr:14270_t:CDS:2 [Funneliformis caledonium]